MAAPAPVQESDVDITRRRIEELIATKEWRGAVLHCEELELLAGSKGTPFRQEDAHHAKVHMVLLLVLGDVNNARHLWRRLPDSAKATGGELAALWDVGKFIWKREMTNAQDTLRGKEWGALIMPLVSLLRERLFERQLELISQAYTCLPLERAAAMLGCSVDDAEKVCIKQGWTVEAGVSKMVKPSPSKPAEHVASTTTPDYLQKMARHIAFLERQSLG